MAHHDSFDALLDAPHAAGLARGEAPTAPMAGEEHHWGDVMPSPTEERPLAPATPAPRPAPAAAARTPAASPGAPRSRAEGEGHTFLLWLGLGGAAVLAVIVAFVLLSSSRRISAPVAQAATMPAPQAAADDPANGAVEAGALEAMGAEAPALAAGEPPPSPAPGGGLSPTIVCRLLVDARGQVVKASVYQSRPDLGAFEAAALLAVSGYRFAPARKAGVPVAAWVNWPIQFR